MSEDHLEPPSLSETWLGIFLNERATSFEDVIQTQEWYVSQFHPSAIGEVTPEDPRQRKAAIIMADIAFLRQSIAEGIRPDCLEDVIVRAVYLGYLLEDFTHGGRRREGDERRSVLKLQAEKLQKDKHEDDASNALALALEILDCLRDHPRVTKISTMVVEILKARGKDAPKEKPENLRGRIRHLKDMPAKKLEISDRSIQSAVAMLRHHATARTSQGTHRKR